MIKAVEGIQKVMIEEEKGRISKKGVDVWFWLKEAGVCMGQ